MRRYLPAAVFVCALGLLAFRVDQVGIASGYVDPVGHIAAQDEAVYTHTAMRMARRGGWLTPMFLGRYALYKQPLLYWLSGFSIKLCGASPLCVRLPSLLAGAAVAFLVFSWASKTGFIWQASGAALLLASNHLWFTVSRMNLMDALLTCWIVASLYCVQRDPRLEERISFWGFSVFTAAAIMTKGIAGLLPLCILLVACLLLRQDQRPRLRQILRACLVIAALALPWHLYQLIVHTRWFWAEYLLDEILGFGLGAPPQTSQEQPAVFYLKRLFLIDPILSVFAALGLPSLVLALRERKSRDVLLAAWIVVICASILVFRYRNAAYLLPLVAPLCIIASRYAQPIFIGILCAALLVKISFGDEPWGISYRTRTTIESAPPLDFYAQRHRPNELILISPDDEFYSAILPLPKVRYCYLNAAPRLSRPALDFEQLGIIVSAEQFGHLDEWRPIFLQRLQAWGLDSGEPIATVIFARSVEEIHSIIASHPSSDFFVPAQLAPPGPPRHEVVSASAGKLFLLARP